MAEIVPESAGGRDLGEVLDGLLEFTGATAGWVGLSDASGRLTFPVRRGTFPEAWLTLQQGHDNVWGFEVREGPTLLNDLRAFPPLGSPPLLNLLSCPLGAAAAPAGHVVLANKPAGFTSHDAAVLQGMAHLIARRLRAGGEPARGAGLPSPLLRRVLDRVGEGVVAVNGGGTLVYANATWLAWTGFREEEVVGRPAPFPFWISHRELAAVGGAAGPGPEGALPFRRRDHSLLWCRVETVAEQAEGRPLTVAFLRPVPAAGPAPRPEPRRPVALPLLLEELPFALALVDRQGRLLWSNAALGRLLPPAGPARPEELLRDRLGPTPAAVLEHLVRDPGSAQPGRMGSLVLPRPAGPLTGFWLAVGRPEGAGFLLALTDDPEGFALTDALPPAPARAVNLPAPGWLALLLRPEGEVSFWSERWQRLTGLSAADLAGVRGELVLDWLFPQQRDRELVADYLHRPRPQGGQAVLQVLTRSGGRPLLCTFLPVTGPGTAEAGPEAWLLLVGEPELFTAAGGPSLGFVRQFTRGLGVLLNHYLTVPVGLAEIALDRPDLPREVGGWFQQILDSCQKATRLITALEDLAAVTPGETALVPLAALVREFLDELPPPAERGYELLVDLRDPQVPVRVNRRMLRVVLGHLFANAEQALAHAARRQIEVRVLGGETTVRCEVHDTGEGLPAEDWARPLTPFYSTRGAFARDPAHAAQEATGLGLTVSQHLLALHNGHIELRSPPGEGTTAAVVLPRADLAAAAALGPTSSEMVRVDPPAAAAEPHARKEWSAADPPPV